jgi:uncharacterized membrane protein YidH (DUF202 family)
MRLVEKLVGLFRMGRRGQLSVQNLLGIFVLIIIMSALMPAIIEIIQIALNVVDTTTAILLALVPLVLVAALIKTIMDYASSYVWARK